MEIFISRPEMASKVILTDLRIYGLRIGMSSHYPQSCQAADLNVPYRVMAGPGIWKNQGSDMQRKG